MNEPGTFDSRPDARRRERRTRLAAVAAVVVIMASLVGYGAWKANADRVGNEGDDLSCQVLATADCF